MKGDANVIKHMNGILTNELSATNQYFLHARILKNWGILILADKIYEESIGEMKHADLLIERILMLDGLPNLQDLHSLKVGESVEEMFTADMALEKKNQADLKEAIKAAEKANDYVSRDMLIKILTETEEHIDWIEAQQDLIRMAGIQNYIQERIGRIDDE